MMLSLICDYCGCSFKRAEQYVIRAPNPNFYCSRKCSSLRRRNNKSLAQKRAEKAAYDAQYRARNLATIRARKAAYFKRTYDPAKAKIERKANMHRHIAYCRQPKYRQWKSQYDKRYKARIHFGPYAESHLLLQQIQAEVDARMSDYEIRLQQGTLNKAQIRRRKLYEKTSIR